MQRSARSGAGTGNIARILGDFRLVEHNVYMRHKSSILSHDVYDPVSIIIQILFFCKYYLKIYK